LGIKTIESQDQNSSNIENQELRMQSRFSFIFRHQCTTLAVKLKLTLDNKYMNL